MSMTAKESKAVAWQWHTGGPQFCTPEDKVKRLAAGDGFAKGYTIPLVPESALHAAEAELGELRRRVVSLVEALRATEFGFAHRRCPVCAGFNVGPNGETDRVHTKNCIVGKALLASDGGADGACNHEWAEGYGVPAYCQHCGVAK